MVNLGQRVGALAKLKGLKQQAIADQIAVSRISVNRFFNGHTEIRSTDFVLMLKALGIDIEAQIQSAMSCKQ